MTKVIKIYEEVDSCRDCMYCKYDSYYDRSRDSGYDCTQTYKRLVDDYEIKAYNKHVDAVLDSEDTLFPLKITMQDPLGIIPEWCPLEEKQDG